MSNASIGSVHEEAVRHARLAERAADFTWQHLEAEYTQDIESVLATIASDDGLTWTLAQEQEDGSMSYLSRVNMDEIRGQYTDMRHFVEIWGWEALVEIRQSWYVMTQGIVTLKLVETGEYTRSQTVTMFPIGSDGILGEVQIGGVGARIPAVPEAGTLDPSGRELPVRRIEARANHDRYLAAIRDEDVAAIVAANNPRGAAAIRSYLVDDFTVLTTTGVAELEAYYTALFQRFTVLDVQIVNRVVESWYLFAELHWTVEERGGRGRKLEYCTADTSPLDAEGRYWVHTGAGTDPVEL